MLKKTDNEIMAFLIITVCKIKQIFEIFQMLSNFKCDTS